MCGRFTRNYTWEQIRALYRLTAPAAIPNLQPSAAVERVEGASYESSDARCRCFHRSGRDVVGLAARGLRPTANIAVCARVRTGSSHCKEKKI
jgi:hypothetical protein